MSHIEASGAIRRIPPNARLGARHAGARACAIGGLCATLLAGAAAGAQAQVPGGPVTLPPPPPPPPLAIPAPAPDPPAPAPQPPVSAGELSPKLTQIYRGDDGGALYLRAEGTKVVGFAEHPGRKYALVFRGTRAKDLINGSWYDVAKGSRATVGTIVLKIFKEGDRLVRSSGSDFGPDAFDAIAAGSFPWPGAREAGFQARSRSDMDGAFIGKTSAMEPDGSRQYWRETVSGAFGVAESAAKAGKRPAWVSVFFGKRQADGSVSGEYFDVPKGTETRSGTFSLAALKFGRQYALGSSGQTGRPTRIEADYALDFDKIADAVDKHFDKKVVGFGWAISSDGKVVRDGGGGNSYLSEDKNGFDINRPFTSSTESVTASTTKLVTATAVMQVLAKKGMSVKSLAYPYYPDCWKLGPGMMSLTFEKLLDMSSGLFRPAKEVKAEDLHLFVMKAAEGGLTGKKGYENMNYAHLGWLLAGLLDKPGVEASFAKHGCGKATKAYGETMDIYGDYVINMLADEGVAAGWNYRTGNRALKYNFLDQSLAGILPVTTVVNPTGGLMINAIEFGEFLAKLEHGRFVDRATVEAMKDGEYGFDDLIPGKGGPANAFRASDGLGLADKKNGGCGNDKGRGCGSQLVMLPGDVQIVALFNSRNNATSKNSTGLRDAWQAGIK
jgi:hypothetical protein